MSITPEGQMTAGASIAAALLKALVSEGVLSVDKAHQVLNAATREFSGTSNPHIVDASDVIEAVRRTLPSG